MSENKKIAPPKDSLLEKLLAQLPVNEQEKLLADVETYKQSIERENAQKSFMAYVKMMWPGFVGGRHHALMASKRQYRLCRARGRDAAAAATSKDPVRNALHHLLLLGPVQ